MKKFLLVVFLLVLTVPVYGLENSIKYKYYRLNKVMGPLVFKDDISEEFPLIDEANPVKTKLSELSINKPMEKDGREIYEFDGYHYLKVPMIDSLEIVVGSNSNIYNIDITSVNGEIEFKSDNDGSLDSNETGNFSFSPTNINDLIINLQTGGGDNFHFVTLYFKSNNVIVSSLKTSARPSANHTFKGTQSILQEKSFENVYFTDEQNDDNLIYQGQVKLYQYFDYQYQSYKLEKEYYPDYLSEPFEDYIYRDDNDYIIEEVLDNDNESTSISASNIPDTKTVDNGEVKNLVKKIENKNQFLDKKIPEVILDNDVPNINKEKPKQYQSVLKMDNNKTISNKVDNSKMYTYFILVILVILLLLMLKVRNRLKNSFRW